MANKLPDLKVYFLSHYTRFGKFQSLSGDIDSSWEGKYTCDPYYLILIGDEVQKTNDAGER